MAHVLNDRVKETTATTGTGTIDLDGAETGFESFVAGIGNSNSTYYAIAHTTLNEFEIGIGTVTDASPDTLSRTTVISSTNSDNLVNFSAGLKDVFCTLPASKAVFFDPSSGSSDVAIGSRGTNPMGLGIVGTVLAVTEQTNVASIQMDGNQASRIDMGSGPGTRQFVIYTDTANYSSLERKDAKPILFSTDNTERFRILQGGGIQLAASNDISNASGSMTIDVADNLSLDVDGGNIALKDAGTQWGNFANNSSDFDIDALIQDKDIKFNGNDGGSTITAGFFDMSDAGRLNLNGGLDIVAGTDIEGNYGNWTGEKSAKIQFHANHCYIQTVGNLYHRSNSGTNTFVADNGGNVTANGDITAFGNASDIKLKENVEVINNAIDKIKQLKGVTFTYKKDGKKSTGLIAQDLEKVLPEAVYTSETIDNEINGEESEEFLAIRYGNTVGLLVEAIKEQQKEIDTLNDYVKLQSATIMDMERRLNELEDK